MTDYRNVPVEPTPEMLDAGKYAMGYGGNASDVYAAMLAAAPAVQEWPPRHPATPSFFEYPSFEESADFDPVPVQQPAPDVAGLVEALEVMLEMVELGGFGKAYAMDIARAALAASREQGGGK